MRLLLSGLTTVPCPLSESSRQEPLGAERGNLPLMP